MSVDMFDKKYTFNVSFGAEPIRGLSALNFWSNNFSISAQPSFDQKTQPLVVSKKETCWYILCENYYWDIFMFTQLTTVKTSELQGMLSLSDWCPYFLDMGGHSYLFQLSFIHLFDHWQKKMWYLCDSICLHVWVMDKGNKFSLPPLASINIYWTSQISTLGKFVWNLWFSHFPISSSNRFGPIPPLQAHPWGILNFCDVLKISHKYFTKS